MKRFRFSLQSVRELREAQEQAAQRVYAGAVRVCEELATQLMLLERDLQNVWQGLRHHALAGMRAEQLRHARAWSCVLEEKQKELVAGLATAQKQVDAAHEQLVAATRRRESMDRLFRRKRRSHERETQIEEQKFLDQLATRNAWQAAPMEAA
jgi:flagellar export protein FliJ